VYTGSNRGDAMLDIEVYRDLCSSVSTEKDPAKRDNLRAALRFMLRSEEIELHRIEKNPGLRPN
jgi:hypothetical protein